MAELLKVLKILCISAFKALCRMRYKGLYAFLSGVMVFSVCFAGKGEVHGEIAHNNAAAACEALVMAGETAPVSDRFLGAKKVKAQRVPYDVYPDGASALSMNSAGNANKVNNAIYDGSEAYGGIESVDAYQETDLIPSDSTDSHNPDNSDIFDSETITDTDSEQYSNFISDSGTDGDQNDINASKEKEEEETAADEKPDERWTETKTSGIKYINTDKIYSRAAAIEGSEKINLYRINDTVKVTAKTDTHYYKTESGEFIHEDYISEEETPKWIESPVKGIMYIRKDGIYSREEAIEGSVKLNQYNINETVKITALTDTHYYKTENGEFIHEDYLSEEETPKWIESPAEGVMYVSSDGIYSREEAIEGSSKVNRYSLNDTVNVKAKTNTGYCKLESGEFIHSDFLSHTETVEYPISGNYGQRAQTDREKELARQMFEAVNAVRAEYGLKPFKQLDSLTAAAAERAWEVTFNTSHTRPDGTKCFTILDRYGLSNPSSKAENIAKWYPSAEKVVNCWMNDYAHRVNILGDHEYMGAGCYYIDGDYYGYYWTQIFYTP